MKSERVLDLIVNEVRLMIGYFGRWVERPRVTAVHIVTSDYKPWCVPGQKMSDDNTFYWCAEATTHTVHHYVTCAKCLKKWRRAH